MIKSLKVPARLLFISFLSSMTVVCAAGNMDSDIPNGISDRIVGDIGVAVYSTNLNIGSYGTQSIVLPYGFFDYQRFAMRIDQVAFKTLPFGFGFLEIVGKVDPDSYKVKSTINGQTINKGYQVPIGLGTFQDTPIGAFFINAYHDFGSSKGNLFELNYFGEIELVSKVTLYPQVGIERQSGSFANYYYGVTPGQTQITEYRPYTATGSNNPLAGFFTRNTSC